MDKCVILTSLLALGLYLNTLPAEFAYDDSRAILKNPDLLPETPAVNLWYDDFWGTPLTHSGSHKSYRPLCVLTFRFNYYLAGLEPLGYHLGNVLLHALVTGVFTYTAKLLLKRQWPALLAGLMFASHPVHTEAVAGVVGRADILACLFFLLAFLSYHKYCKFRDKNVSEKVDEKEAGKPELRRSRRWVFMLATALFTAAAMLSKEIGITVLAVCATFDLFLHSRIKVKDIIYIFQKQHRGLLEGMISLAAIGISFIAFRVIFMGNKPPEFAPADNPASDSDSFLTRTLTFFYLPVLNFKLLVFPFVLSFDWSMGAVPLVTALTDFRNLYTAGFYGVLFYAGYLIIKNQKPEVTAVKVHHNGNGCSPTVYSNAMHAKNGRKRHGRRGSTSSTDSNEDANSVTLCMTSNRTVEILIVSLALLIFPFIPATNLFFYVGFVIAERVLYIPSMGFCILVAEGVYSAYRKHYNKGCSKLLIYSLLACLLVGYSARTVLRNRDWLTEENLYKSGISVNPAKAYGNLANIFNGQKKTAEAEAVYRAALRHRGNMADVHYNLGILLQEQKRYQEAIDSYKLAIQCRPRLTMAHLNLGIIYAAIGRKEEADKIYRHCSEIDISGLKDPRLHEQTKISALYNLGRLLVDQEKYQEALEAYQEAVRRRPSHYAPQSLYNMLGEAYSKLDRLEEAEYWYNEALVAKADHIPAHLTMGKLNQKRGKLTEAEDWFLKAKLLAPTDSSVYQHYGQFLGEVGRHSEAADNYIIAAQKSPEDFELNFNTANALRQAGRNLEAEAFYKKAAELKPNEATAHMNLGAMLHLNGKLKEAENSYLMALQLRPQDHVTKTNLQKLRNLMAKSKNDSKR